MTYKIKKSEDVPTARGTGFFIDGFGQISIEWVEPETFNKDYDKVQVIKAFIKASERLFTSIDNNYK